MPKEVSRHAVADLRAEGAPIVEVLPRSEYDYEHIAGAINIPLKRLDAATTAALPEQRPVVVYCHDFL